MKNLLTIACTLLTFSCLAQNVVKGTIQQLDQQPIAYATISAMLDTAFVDGTVSDEAGQFELILPDGNYQLIIESIAFESKTVENVLLANRAVVQLETIILSSQIQALEGVEVVAEQSRLQIGLDKRTFNVGKDILSQNGSVSDVLQNIPSVTVAPDGQISFRGSTSVKILIDGKPSAMASPKVLRNLQSNMVEKVEIITNPSAEYDAAGLTGIINIVLKKEKKAGLTGSMNADVSFPQDYGIGISLNRNKDKFNIFTNVGLRHWQRFRNGQSTNFYTLPDTTYSTIITSEQTRRSYAFNMNVGMDYQLNEQSTLTSTFFYEVAHQPHNGSTFYEDFDTDNRLTNSELRGVEEVELEYSLQYKLEYTKAFEKKGQKLSTWISYTDNTEDNDSNIEAYETDAFRNPLNNIIEEQRTALDEQDQQLTFQLDYNHPFAEKGSLKVGAKSNLRLIQNQFKVEERLEDWEVLKNLSNDFNYHENVTAAYATLKNQFKGFSYKIGLRAELTDLKTELLQTNEVNNRKPFVDLFPSAHLGYKTKTGYELGISYSRRIERPKFGDLSPFFSFRNDRFISVGNPDLNPMYTHSTELNILKNWDKITVGASAYNRFTNNIIEETITLDANGIAIQSPQNIGKEMTNGVELYTSLSIKKWLKLEGNFNYWNAILDGSQSVSTIQLDYVSWMTQFGARFQLPKEMELQTSYFYQGKSTNVRGTQKAFSRFDVGLSKKVMDGRGNWTFSVKDVFNTYRFDYEEVNDVLTTTGFYRPWRPTLTLGFGYRWK